jgi:hypothetical protein
MPYGFRDFINVHLGNGDGTFQEEIVYDVGQGPRWIVSADFNGDGHADLATANSGQSNEGRETLTVLFGTGAGEFTGRTDDYAPFSPDLMGVTGLAQGDVDGDGDTDLMMTTVAGGVAVYRNDGLGNFSVEPRIGISWGPWDLVYEDVTGDGIGDLVAITSDGLSGLGRFLGVVPGTAGTVLVGEPRDPGAASPIRLSRVHPNPMGGTPARVTLRASETNRVVVGLYDVTGRRVRPLYAGEVTGGAEQVFALDPSELASGVYFVRASGREVSISRAFVVVR